MGPELIDQRAFIDLCQTGQKSHRTLTLTGKLGQAKDSIYGTPYDGGKYYIFFRKRHNEGAVVDVLKEWEEYISTADIKLKTALLLQFNTRTDF